MAKPSYTALSRVQEHYAIDWRRMFGTNWEIFCVLAQSFADIAGVMIGKEESARWLLDLYIADRQHAVLDQARNAYTEAHKSSGFIDLTPNTPQLIGPAIRSDHPDMVDQMARRALARAVAERRLKQTNPASSESAQLRALIHEKMKTPEGQEWLMTAGPAKTIVIDLLTNIGAPEPTRDRSRLRKIVGEARKTLRAQQTNLTSTKRA
jgi:hypothetical protein